LRFGFWKFRAKHGDGRYLPISVYELYRKSWILVPINRDGTLPFYPVLSTGDSSDFPLRFLHQSSHPTRNRCHTITKNRNALYFKQL